MKRLIWATAAALALSAPTLASAENGVITGPIHMRSGPGWSNSLQSNIPAQARITIAGCTSKWDWCSVSYHNDHGWVPATYVRADLMGQQVPVTAYTTRTGLPVIGSEGPESSKHVEPAHRASDAHPNATPPAKQPPHGSDSQDQPQSSSSSSTH